MFSFFVACVNASSSLCHGMVCGLYLWYVLVTLTFFSRPKLYIAKTDLITHLLYLSFVTRLLNDLVSTLRVLWDSIEMLWYNKLIYLTWYSLSGQPRKHQTADYRRLPTKRRLNGVLLAGLWWPANVCCMFSYVCNHMHVL